MARASTPTLLSLDRWAEIMQLNPVHFAGAQGGTIWPYGAGACKDVWHQYAWQSPDLISREELARQIYLAEVSIMRALGYAPAPTWFVGEEHSLSRRINPYARYRETVPTIQTKYRYVIAGGRRAVTAVQLGATVVYSDEDSDGFIETATVTLTGVTVSDVQEIQLFFAGKMARAEWRIRPLDSATLVSGTYTAVFKSWLAINPALWEQYPGSYEQEPIDISTNANFVGTVDVYRVFNSQETAPSKLYAINDYYCGNCGNSGCSLCAEDGCLLVENELQGFVRAMPAAFDDDSQSWIGSVCQSGWYNQKTKIWYQAGYRSQEYLAGETDDPLDRLLAEAITMLATARLSKPVCSCSNVRLMADDLRRDFAFSDKNSFNLIWRSGVVQTNPFGTKAGEVRAWKIVGEIIADAVIGTAM